MSNVISSAILTPTAHPHILSLSLLVLALVAAFTLDVISTTRLHHGPDREEHAPVFINEETRALLDGQDPLKDYPDGRRVTRAGSAGRAKRWSAKRAVVRWMVEAEWAEASCGTFPAGPRVEGKRKMRGEGVGRGKRVRKEEGF